MPRSLLSLRNLVCNKATPSLIQHLSYELSDVIVAATAVVEVSAVVPCLNELKAILVKATVEVKALVGLKLEVILASSGKILAIIDVCNLLVSLLAVSRDILLYNLFV